MSDFITAFFIIIGIIGALGIIGLMWNFIATKMKLKQFDKMAKLLTDDERKK